jgi:cytochrome c
MKAKAGQWTDDDLNKFVANPKGYIPGTAMGFAGIPRDSERADVIAYLHTLADKPVPLPTAAK